MRKNTVIECVNSRIKKIILNSSNLIFKLKQWRVEVRSTKRKVKTLKSGHIFLAFLDLESGNDQ